MIFALWLECKSAFNWICQNDLLFFFFFETVPYSVLVVKSCAGAKTINKQCDIMRVRSLLHWYKMHLHPTFIYYISGFFLLYIRYDTCTRSLSVACNASTKICIFLRANSFAIVFFLLGCCYSYNSSRKKGSQRWFFLFTFSSMLFVFAVVKQYGKHQKNSHKMLLTLLVGDDSNSSVPKLFISKWINQRMNI